MTRCQLAYDPGNTNGPLDQEPTMSDPILWIAIGMMLCGVVVGYTFGRAQVDFNRSVQARERLRSERQNQNFSQN